MLSLSNASGAPSRDASSIFPVVLTGADDTDEASARLRALWKECRRSLSPGGNIAISASSVPFSPNVVGESLKTSPFSDKALIAGSSGGAETGVPTVSSAVVGSGTGVATAGDAALFGDPFGAVTDLSLFNGNIGSDEDEAGGCDELEEINVMGDVARAGFPVDDPMLEILACRMGADDGGGNGPRPSNDTGFVAAATADAYLSSIGGRAACAGGFGTPFV